MKKVYYILLGILMILFQGCDLYPDDAARVEDLDVVITYYDQSTNFDRFSTYVIIDSVREITSDTTISTPIADSPLAPETSDFILNVIRTNLSNYGYTEVDDPNNADLAVNVGAIEVTNISITSLYPSYWYGCGIYWCDPGYWYGYPGVPYFYPWAPTTIVSAYESGTLIVDIISLDFDENSDQGLPILWTGVLRGITAGSDQEIRERAEDGINQAFDQSPVLNKN